MMQARHGRSGSSSRLRLALNLLGLVVLGICLLCVGLVRFFPYSLDFTTFPRTTQTRAGAAGDPINLIFIGSKAQISDGFQHAGWVIPDPISAASAARIAAASLAHQAYPTAPVSNLYAFGRVQDLAFEKPTNDVQFRGHIRLWQTGESLEGQPVWIAQASYDNGIELSATNAAPTHHIAPTVDFERNDVGADLRKTRMVTAEATAAYSTPILAARNGGGDFYESDGDALVVNFTQASVPLHAQSWWIAGLKTNVFFAYDTILSAGGIPIVVVTLLIMGIIGLTLYHRRAKRMPASELPA